MEITVVGSTNNITSKELSLKFGRAAGRVCYSEKDFEDIVEEGDKKQLMQRLLNSGHHSVFDHVHFNFYFEGIPKIGAIILNNEGYYATSEKSARYTKMELEGLQKELYNKWFGIFKEKIKNKYGDILNDDRITKLAQENARYLTSVFTPTKMLHTLSFRQTNSLMHYFEDFIANGGNALSPQQTKFYNHVKSFMQDFLENQTMKELYVPELKSLNQRKLSLFSDGEDFDEHFGKVYSTEYDASFACLAQLHRHRTLRYEMNLSGIIEFFIPPILGDDRALKANWVADCKSVEDDWPQGRLIRVRESGLYTDFISKMNERLCGHAQLEIQGVTKKTLTKYLEATEKTNPKVHKILSAYSNGPRCTFNKCRGACEFGEESLDRLI